MATSHQSYDAVAYASYPYPEASPAWMATVAALYGLDGADPVECSVLELGCGDGGNLLALAAASPALRAVGFDPAEVAIARGARVARRVGAQNLTLEHDAAALALDGTADYVITHGVLTWISDEERSTVFAQAASAARPGALLSFSYRSEPLTHYERAARDMAKLAIEIETERAAERGGTLTWRDEVRIARERVALAASTAGDQLFHGSAMRMISEKWAGLQDWTVYHDDLSGDLRTFRITDLVAEAAGHGLTYVGELGPEDLWQVRLDPATADTVRELGGPDAARRQQVADDLLGTGFHSSLFVKDGGDASPQLEPGLRGRAFHARVQAPGRPDVQSRADEVSAPVAQVLREHHPGAVLSPAIAEELGRDQADVDDALLRLYGHDLARLTAFPPPPAAPAGEHPRTLPIVADQLRQRSDVLFTRFHVAASVPHNARRVVLMLADGQRDRAAILRDLPDAAARAGMMEDLDAVMADLDDVLGAAAQAGLLAVPDEA